MSASPTASSSRAALRRLGSLKSTLQLDGLTHAGQPQINPVAAKSASDEQPRLCSSGGAARTRTHHHWRCSRRQRRSVQGRKRPRPRRGVRRRAAGAVARRLGGCGAAGRAGGENREGDEHPVVVQADGAHGVLELLEQLRRAQVPGPVSTCCGTSCRACSTRGCSSDPFGLGALDCSAVSGCLDLVVLGVDQAELVDVPGLEAHEHCVRPG